MMKALLVAIAVMAVVRPEDLSGLSWALLLAAGIVVAMYLALPVIRVLGPAARSMFGHGLPRDSRSD